MWEINNSLQLLNLVRSVGVGIFFCLIYDILRALRKNGNFSVAAIFLQDVLFSVFITFITFFFLLSTTNGELRGFVIFGMFSGFLVCRFTVSFFVYKILCFVLSKLKWLFSFFSNGFYSIFELLELNTLKILKKSGKTLKKLLKTLKGLLYTKLQ